MEGTLSVHYKSGKNILYQNVVDFHCQFPFNELRFIAMGTQYIIPMEDVEFFHLD